MEYIIYNSAGFDICCEEYINIFSDIVCKNFRAFTLVLQTYSKKFAHAISNERSMFAKTDIIYAINNCIKFFK